MCTSTGCGRSVGAFPTCTATGGLKVFAPALAADDGPETEGSNRLSNGWPSSKVLWTPSVPRTPKDCPQPTNVETQRPVFLYPIYRIIAIYVFNGSTVSGTARYGPDIYTRLTSIIPGGIVSIGFSSFRLNQGGVPCRKVACARSLSTTWGSVPRVRHSSSSPITSMARGAAHHVGDP